MDTSGSDTGTVNPFAGFSTSEIQRYARHFSLAEVGPEGQRRLAEFRWALRRCWGKTLNILRLFKAAGTFSNGIDYLLWKVERHSGVRVEATERMRRHPRLAAWGLAWKLWRKGAFR